MNNYTYIYIIICIILSVYLSIHHIKLRNTDINRKNLLNMHFMTSTRVFLF